jgi:small subunit ribosomal protein S6
MRKYETIVVTKTDAGHEAQRRLYDKIIELLAKAGARHVRFELWGKRRLAYPIGKSLKGIYMYHVYLADGDFVKELNRILRLSNIVLRYLTVMVEADIDPEAFDFERESQFDTLPSEADESEHGRSTTGWDAEFRGAPEKVPSGDSDDDDDDDDEGGSNRRERGDDNEDEE